MDKQVTKRLAARNFNFEKISLQWIFKIVESILEKKIVSTKKYYTKSGSPYCVVEFVEPEDARIIYEYCDSLQIEDTGELFDLAFIPDGMDLGMAEEECLNLVGYKFQKPADVNNQQLNDVEMSNEDDKLDIEIPVEFKGEEEFADLKKPKEDPVADEEAEKVKEALEQKETAGEISEFKFNIKDERFAKVFENEEFSFDASHRKFKRNPETTEILNEFRKKFDDN